MTMLETRSPRLGSRLSRAMGAVFVAAVCGAPAVAEEGVPGNERPVILHLRNGAEVSGVITSGGFDEANGVKLRRDDNGGLLELRWDQILADDVESIKRSYGFIGDDPPPIQIQALKLNVRGGRSLLGLDGGRQGTVHLLFKKGVATSVPLDSIESRETVIVDALEVENPPEAFERVRREEPPKTAVEWYNLGLIAESLTLFEQADDCFDQALAVDPGFVKKDSIVARKKILTAKAKEVDAANQLRNIRTLRLQKNYLGALKLVEEFMSKWPSSVLTSDVMKEHKQLASAQHEQLLNDIRTNFFPVARSLCMTKALEAELELGPAMTWAEEVCFGEALKKVAKQLGIVDDVQAMKLWEQRGKYGSATASSYGGGTFILQEDARKGLESDDKKDDAKTGEEKSEDTGKPKTLQEKIKEKLQAKMEAAKKANQKNKTTDGGDLADVPPTPEEWWLGASTKERTDFLFAFFGEHARSAEGKEGVVLVESVSWRDCSVCAAKGVIESYQSGATSNGQMGVQSIPCPRCKKLTFDRIVRFK